VFVRQVAVSVLVALSGIADKAGVEVTVAGSKENANGFLSYTVTCPYEGRPTQVEVLPPDDMTVGKLYPVLYLLPVNDGITGPWGSGIVEAKRHDIHNRFQVICVAPEYDYTPWFGDHPKERALRQESYLLEVVMPLIEERYPVIKGKKGRFLLGFSKSGFGAMTIALRNLERIGGAAAWDAPLMMRSPLPPEEEMQRVFASQENFNAYCIPALVDKHLEALRAVPPRLALVSNGTDQGSVVELHKLLESRGVPHRFAVDEKREHTWTSQWLPMVAQLLLE